MKKYFQHEKKWSHPVLTSFGKDKFSLRINESRNNVTHTPFISFSFELENIVQKTRIPEKTKSKWQQNPLLKEADLDNVDDSNYYRIPKKNLFLTLHWKSYYKIIIRTVF